MKIKRNKQIVKMVNKSDITVIIPVHKWNEEIKAMYKEARKSIPEGVEVMVVTTSDSGFETDEPVKWHIGPFQGESAAIDGIGILESNDGSSFQHLVNLGVSNVQTEWFSILEFDDEYSSIWFDNFIKYQEYNQQYNIFLPLNDLYNVEDGKDEFVGNGNEAVMAASFADEIGVIDEKALDDYFGYYVPGGIIKTELWRNAGGLKENIKLTFWYEFLLRIAHLGEKIYVVPKVGYAHVLGRKDSLMDEYRKTIDKDESEFWFREAKKQSYFKVDKNVEYDPDWKSRKEEETESENELGITDEDL